MLKTSQNKEPFLFKSYEKIIGIAHDVNELKTEMERLSKVDPEAVNYHLKEKHIVNWLNYIGESELAKKLEGVTNINDALIILKEGETAHISNSQEVSKQEQKPKRRGGRKKKKEST